MATPHSLVVEAVVVRGLELPPDGVGPCSVDITSSATQPIRLAPQDPTVIPGQTGYALSFRGRWLLECSDPPVVTVRLYGEDNTLLGRAGCEFPRQWQVLDPPRAEVLVIFAEAAPKSTQGARQDVTRRASFLSSTMTAGAGGQNVRRTLTVTINTLDGMGIVPRKAALQIGCVFSMNEQRTTVIPTTPGTVSHSADWRGEQVEFIVEPFNVAMSVYLRVYLVANDDSLLLGAGRCDLPPKDGHTTAHVTIDGHPRSALHILLSWNGNKGRRRRISLMQGRAQEAGRGSILLNSSAAAQPLAPLPAASAAGPPEPHVELPGPEEATTTTLEAFGSGLLRRVDEAITAAVERSLDEVLSRLTALERRVTSAEDRLADVRDVLSETSANAKRGSVAAAVPITPAQLARRFRAIDAGGRGHLTPPEVVAYFRAAAAVGPETASDEDLMRDLAGSAPGMKSGVVTLDDFAAIALRAARQ